MLDLCGDFKLAIDFGDDIRRNNRRLQVGLAWAVDGYSKWDHVACTVGLYSFNNNDRVILKGYV